MDKNNIIIKKIFALAFQNHRKNNLEAAEKLYRKILKIDPHNVVVLNNLGVILNETSGMKKAITFFKKAVNIQDNYAEAHNNLGNAYRELGSNDEAINCYLKAIQINSNFTSAHYNLGKTFKKLKKYKEAIDSFQKVDTAKSRAQLLECIYLLKGFTIYQDKLKVITEYDPFNLRIAALAAYVSLKENIKNIYPFCKNPLDLIFIKNLKNELNLDDRFTGNLLRLLKEIRSVWEPSSTTTKGGYQTTGNLFNIQNDIITKLKKEIETQIIVYKENFKLNEDGFIKKWPTKNYLQAWYVKMFKQGYQGAHIHPPGWLSGVFYIKVPKLLNNNEGSIKFQFFGYDYPEDENLPNLIHTPKDYDLVLFPSSLFHKTIPFSNKDERHCIAFDLNPK